MSDFIKVNFKKDIKQGVFEKRGTILSETPQGQFYITNTNVVNCSNLEITKEEYDRLCNELGVDGDTVIYKPCCIDRVEFVLKWLVESVNMGVRHLSYKPTGEEVLKILNECVEEIKHALRGDPDEEMDGEE